MELKKVISEKQGKNAKQLQKLTAKKVKGEKLQKKVKDQQEQ